MSGTRAISTTSRRELSSSFFIFLQGKALKEIHAILTETLACFLPGQAKDLSAPLYNPPPHGAVTPSVPSGLQAVPLQGKAPKEIDAILTETLACFLPGRAKYLSAPLYNPPPHGAVTPSVPSGLQAVSLQGKAPKEIDAILTETLACFLPGRAKYLSAPLYLHNIPSPVIILSTAASLPAPLLIKVKVKVKFTL